MLVSPGLFLGISEYCDGSAVYSHGAIVESSRAKLLRISVKDFIGIQKSLEDDTFYLNSLELHRKALELLARHRDIYLRIMTRKKSSKSLVLRPSSKPNSKRLLHKLSQTKTSNRKMDNQFKWNKRALFLQKRSSSNQTLPYNSVFKKMRNKENRINRSSRRLGDSEVKKNIFNLTSGNTSYQYKKLNRKKQSYMDTRPSNKLIRVRKNTKFDTFIKLKSISNFVKERPTTRNLSIKRLSIINYH